MKRMKLLTLVFTCSVYLLTGNASANTIEFYYNRYLENKESVNSLEANATEEKYFDQLIDHQQPALGTFSQRYYVNETYATSNNAPVFFYICGEAACNKIVFSGAIGTLAKKFHARLVALEHRYYGVSLPQKDLTTKSLKYLTTDNALKDLARFQAALSKERHWTGKWVAFGGSYPGSLAAYYRLKYPKLVIGSLASSAPVMAKDNFEEYDAHVTKVAGEMCATKMREAVKEVESAMSDEKRFAEIKNMIDANDITDKIDVLSVFAEIGAAAIQYGMRDMACDILKTSKTPLEGYAYIAKYVMRQWQIRPKDLVFQGSMSTDPDYYKNGIGMRQWFYQTCTEYGYWQTANADTNKSSRSKLITLDYYYNGCKRLFGDAKRASVDKINENYYTPLLNENVSQIYFTNGSSDPWSNLSMSAENGNVTNKNLTYYTIEGAAHCDDLRAPKFSDSQSLRLARQKLESLLTSWI